MPLGALRRVEGERRVVERRGPVLKMVGAFEHSTKQHPVRAVSGRGRLSSP